ncbi:hypothetical protein CROQUDRAFT_24589, partial [Cronartium quercuum f. sp. fusiforme G11]
LTLLPVVNKAGMIAGKVYKGVVERVHVELFLKRHVVSPFISFPSSQLLGHYSVLVLNNPKVHHGDSIMTIFQQAGICVIYLPAYFPDSNPIEKGLHCIKHALKHKQAL